MLFLEFEWCLIQMNHAFWILSALWLRACDLPEQHLCMQALQWTKQLAEPFIIIWQCTDCPLHGRESANQSSPGMLLKKLEERPPKMHTMDVVNFGESLICSFFLYLGPLAIQHPIEHKVHAPITEHDQFFAKNVLRTKVSAIIRKKRTVSSGIFFGYLCVCAWAPFFVTECQSQWSRTAVVFLQWLPTFTATNAHSHSPTLTKVYARAMHACMLRRRKNIMTSSLRRFSKHGVQLIVFNLRRLKPDSTTQKKTLNIIPWNQTETHLWAYSSFK